MCAIPPADALAAQDVEFIRAWERAQSQRPREIGARAVIAPTGEPGLRLPWPRLESRRPPARRRRYRVRVPHRSPRPLRRPRRDGPAFVAPARLRRAPTRKGASSSTQSVPHRLPRAVDGPAHPRQPRGLRPPAALGAGGQLPRRSAPYSRRHRRLGPRWRLPGQSRDITMRDGIAHVDYNVRITDDGVF